MGALGGAVPDPARGPGPDQGDPPTQVPDGPAHPRTPPRPARPAGPRPRPGPSRRANGSPPRRRPVPANSSPAAARCCTARRPGPGRPPRSGPRTPLTGARRDLSGEEDRAFWTWAAIETLRHTGIRIEELTELSHHSLVQYTPPTSTARLDPAAADRPVQDRHRTAAGHQPRTGRRPGRRHPPHPPNPTVRSPASPPTTPTNGSGTRPCRCCSNAGSASATAPSPPARSETGSARSYPIRCPTRPTTRRPDRPTPAGQAAAVHPPRLPADLHHRRRPARHATPHRPTGRRAPRHQHHDGLQSRLPRRSDQRPPRVHRPPTRTAPQPRNTATPTDAEWQEFLGHFEHRKVSLGTCGRSYATPCIHEHSCLRCPLLRPEPAQRQRLLDVRDNLITRIDEARREGWLGEVEGLQISLTGARAKLAQLDQITNPRAPISLGIPTRTRP